MTIKNSDQQVLGALEQVSFPDYGIGTVTAKIDTGAYTGAFHCTNIRLEDVDGGKVLHFSPFDHPEITATADNFAVDFVRSSNGERQQRYFIGTTIKIGENEYPITLSLADRSDMKWPVLVGRRFLRQNNLLVDVKKASR